MTKHKPYKDRDHSASKRAKSLRAAVAAQKFGKPTNVGNPNEKMGGKK